MHRIELGNAVFEGKNAVYLLGVDDGPTTLIDAGANAAPVRSDLEAGLSAAGVDPADLDRILVTHFHADHAGLAGWLQERSGASVGVGAPDADRVAADPATTPQFTDRHEALFDEWGVPAEAVDRLSAFLTGHDVRGGPVDVTPVDPGDGFDVGETTLEAVPLPGHTAGLVGFAGDVDGASALFTGDAVLPEYTPNVGGADVRVEDPIATYCETLVRVIRGDYDRAYPGHRHPIERPSRRARTILAHHRERTGTVVDALSDAPADAWTVSARLFGDLEGIHVLHGPGEAWAHLEHLRAADVVAREDGTYRLVDADPDLDALFPTVGE